MTGEFNDLPQNLGEFDLGDKGLKDTWEREISGLTLYHGTSEKNALKIVQEGFDPKVKPYSTDDKKFVEEQLHLRGLDPTNYGKGRDSVFFAQEGTNETTMYALSGPEIIRLDFYPATVDLIKRMDNEKKEGKEVNTDFYDRVVGIKQKLLEDFYGHRPALIKIKRESETFKKIVKEKLAAVLCGVFDDYQVFKNEYQDMVNNFGLSPESAKRFLLRAIKEPLQDMSLDFSIHPEELELISSNDFDGLDSRTRKYANIRSFVFDGEERQPPELLFALYKAVYSPDGNSLKGVLNVCRWYEISDEVGKGLYDKAMAYQKAV